MQEFQFSPTRVKRYIAHELIGVYETKNPHQSMNKLLNIKKKNKIQELIKQARKYSNAGQLKEACGLFNESLKIAEQYYPVRNHIENMRIKEREIEMHTNKIKIKER